VPWPWRRRTDPSRGDDPAVLGKKDSDSAAPGKKSVDPAVLGKKDSDSAAPGKKSVDPAVLGKKDSDSAAPGKKSVDPAVLGKKGEAIARKHLRKAGLKILARNYRCAAGEADLIALDRTAGQLVFVEVKTRSDDTYVEPYAAVDSAKQQRYGRIARTYLAERDTGDLAVRFDVLSVLLQPGRKPAVTHIPEAFSP
jgi:putative endonuclease